MYVKYLYLIFNLLKYFPQIKLCYKKSYFASDLWYQAYDKYSFV